MTYEEEQALLTSNKTLQEQVTKLTDALKAMTEVAPPRHVSTEDAAAGNVSLDDIASGKAIIDMPEPDEEKRSRQLKENEIRRTDRRRINAHIADIASGAMVIVD